MSRYYSFNDFMNDVIEEADKNPNPEAAVVWKNYIM